MADFTAKLKPLYNGAQTIQDERSRSRVNVDELAEHLMTKQYLERQDKITKILEKDPLFSKKQMLNLSRPVRSNPTELPDFA